MGASKKFRPVRAFTVSGFSGTGEDVVAAFRQMVKTLRCPACEVEFSDFAVDWGDAWVEGRLDLLRELERTERDGPFKVKCELCGHRSWVNYFARTVTSAEATGDNRRV